MRYTNTMTTRATLLWVDLEMTGLDPVHDRILEVAAIATDWDFTQYGSYQAAVQVPPALVAERMQVGREFWDAHPQARDGLLQQNAAATRSPAQVEDELLAFIAQRFTPSEPVLLAGNSIHQDRKFIAREWPHLDARLHYRMLDVSAWKVVFDGKYGKRFAKPEEHRALGDIEGSIAELKYYLTKIHAGRKGA